MLSQRRKTMPNTIALKAAPSDRTLGIETLGDAMIKKNESPQKRPLPITYDLTLNSHNSDGFYAKLGIFSKEVEDRILAVAEQTLFEYALFIERDLKQPPRSLGEYAVEFLTLGTTWLIYERAAFLSPQAIVKALRFLYTVRTKYGFLKPLVDPLRGGLSGTYLVPNIRVKYGDAKPLTVATFSAIVSWLDATGEFKDEVKRFDNWQKFFLTISPKEISANIAAALDLGNWFKMRAHEELGEYTKYVENFLRERHPHYRMREDEIFCGKTPVEYHINMVGSEIMNKGFRKEFEKTPKRAVLIPGCMRKNPEKCRSVQDGSDIKCTGCTANCNLNRIAELGKKKGFEVYIVPHSSSFTKWLTRWKNTKEHGVVAIACPLNIIVGGYEMRELNIPSQCVMLDMCGCKKHWDEQGRPTDLNDDRLLGILKYPL
jgi:hypothetical protein